MLYLPSQPQHVIATAYCDIGYTASTRYTVPGTVAVDKHYVSLGSRLRVVFAPAIADAAVVTKFFEHVRTRVFHADDTGGDITGRRIDIWMPSCHEAREFGRRPAVIIVEPKR